MNETIAGVAQLVELQPSKLVVAGSTPVARSKFHIAGMRPGISGEACNEFDNVVDVAQLVELRIVVPAAAGSSPVIHPIIFPRQDSNPAAKNPFDIFPRLFDDFPALVR